MVELLDRYPNLETVIVSDTDTVWLRDPRDYLAQHPAADWFASTDCLSHLVRAVRRQPCDVSPNLVADTFDLHCAQTEERWMVSQDIPRCGHTPGHHRCVRLVPLLHPPLLCSA